MNRWWLQFEKSPQFTRWFSLLWVAILCVIAFLWQLGTTPLLDETEPLFAEAARQMTETGNWVTPYFNEATRFDKPPLVYWLMAIGYQVIGVNEWAARLPSALAAIALIIFSFFTLRTFGFASPKAAQNEATPTSQRQLWFTAWVGSALMALNLQMMAWGRIGVSDMLLTGCMDGSLLCFFWGYVQDETHPRPPSFIPNRWYIAFFVLLALAVLTKGPVGIVIPGLIILSFLLYLGNLPKVSKEAGLIFGFGLFFLLTIPWFILVILENGQAYIDSFFGYHNLERFTRVVNRHSAPWYFYFLVVFVGFIPWSAYLPLAIARLRVWQRHYWQQQPRNAQLGLFAFIWFIAIFLFFSIAVTKLPSYTLPLLPAAAILVALLWSEELSQPHHGNSKGFLASILLNLLCCIALGVTTYWGGHWIGYDPAAPNMGETILESPFPKIGATLWTLTTLTLLLLLLRRRYWKAIIGVNLLSFALTFVFVIQPIYSIAIQQRQAALKNLAQTAAQVKQPQDELMMIGFMKPSIVFYAQHPVLYFSHTPIALKALRKNANDLSPEDTFLIISRPEKIEEANLQPKDYQLIDQQGEYQLVRVQGRRFIRDR
ncbi:glycosyltransferase family 39 protein [Spirulina sp. CS-785/01]|uniref:ArnT family glycosyltransferase n=1 Tax=Spirulina sp. CS-785/01 TaxID=3021716 RepID=UPI00232E93A0|nr:glycosyltransferase family 39 protein [Spirulina sp. CS-785/01]MDB9312847.1 glycosyltransferase family 39 protein [Spirulina sp. CS-785/01]